MEANNKKKGIIDLKRVLDGCTALLGSIKIRIEDMDETGRALDVIRRNIAQCAAFVETELINAPEPTPVEEDLEVEESQLAVEEVVADDGNSYGEPKSESESATDDPIA